MSDEAAPIYQLNVTLGVSGHWYGGASRSTSTPRVVRDT